MDLLSCGEEEVRGFLLLENSLPAAAGVPNI